MPVELMHLMQLAMDQRDSLTVGDLPRPVAEHYGCHPAVVFLGSKVLKKIMAKHTGIEASDVQLLAHMISHGAYYTHHDPNRPHCMNVFCPRPETGKLFLVGLKAADSGHEVGGGTLSDRPDQGSVKAEACEVALGSKKVKSAPQGGGTLLT